MSLVTVGKNAIYIYNYIQNKDIGRKEFLYDKNNKKKEQYWTCRQLRVN